MHYYGERYKHLYLPGSSYITESIQQCTPQSDACSNTCHPVSVIKSPMPRWQSYTQPFTYVCPQPSVTQTSLLSCQPYVQQCVLLYPEPCETTHLLPCRKPSLKLSTMQPCFQPCETSCPEKKRVAKSLPPCAPRCPEPGKVKFPPCGIKYSSSCKDECRSQKISKCSSQRYGTEHQSLRGMTSSYSPPLRGVTECPPQCVTQSFLQEYVSGFPQQKCMKGYPTQECITTYSSQQCVTKYLPQPHVPKCPPGQGIKECSSQQHAVKCSLLQEGAKHKSSSTQHLSKSKCLYPRATHSTQHHAGGVKRSSHSKKSRCASKCLW
ncbi:PREDICTED: uncharacterized protein LOC104014934 [Nipponia nippon]|uniref:uncharacterized protein LOC104014934 n=1 Tax=Nipponia nippon TaxID=128390 RepID=UPI000510E0E9|nr:PREDICTED: uncharacterized protein LOC104014934 [Nipponia nippon]